MAVRVVVHVLVWVWVRVGGCGGLCGGRNACIMRMIVTAKPGMTSYSHKPKHPMGQAVQLQQFIRILGSCERHLSESVCPSVL